jgi:hypothetical protein
LVTNGKYIIIIEIADFAHNHSKLLPMNKMKNDE